MPICTVERKVLGVDANSSALRAFLLPLRAALSSLNFQEETGAISDMENTPFRRIRTRIINISVIIVAAVLRGRI